MARFMLMIEASVNTGGGGAPVLDIYVDGAYVTSSSAITAVTGVGSDLLLFALDFDDTANGYPSSLSFQFRSGTGDPADTVTIESVRINGQALDTGSDLTATILAQGETASVSSTLSRDYLFGRVEPAPADLGTPTQTGTAGGDEIVGTEGADVIDGGAGDDRLRGIGADDAINGGDGNDTIFGENGNDIVIGGLGDDILQGNDGDDLLYGQEGNDRISGGAGNDVLNGGTGNDSLMGDGGDDILYGEAGNDRLIGISGRNTMYGDAGNDVLIGGIDDDEMYGGADNDQLNGGRGNDTLYGEAGDDFLAGGFGNDALSGGDGNDRIDGGGGNDTIDGGAGTDTLLYSRATAGIDVNLATGIVASDGEGGADTVSNIENVTGTAFGDTITGSASGNLLNGGGGADTIISGSADTLAGQISAILAANSGVIYDSTTGNFYKYVNANATWAAADAAARGDAVNGVAGHLVQITSSYENNMIDALAGANGIWLSGTDKGTEGAWVFNGGLLNGIQFWSGTSSGSAVNGFYTNWVSGQPDNGGNSDHQYQLDGGTWDDLKSSGKIKNSYVVEWEGVQLLAATERTTLNGGNDAAADNLYGSDGADTFDFDSLGAVDNVYNYDQTDLDRLDISDLLTGYVAGSSDPDAFARFTVSGDDLLLQVDADGAAGGAGYATVAALAGQGANALLYNVEEMTAKGLLVM